MTNKTLQLVAVKALPALSGAAVTYNAEKNMYLTTGYTSTAGNTYFKAIRMSDRLGVYYDIGIGYSRTFLNGITLFAFNGTKPEMICRATFHCRFFNEEDATNQSVLLLKNFLEGQAKLLGTRVSERQVLEFSRSLIKETHRKMLA
ncbi:MAG: hypothetical protein NC344_00945 [Bacteroidales bacterium]|nr:hypothetical protein [Bacteroidales bacterium]MCM1146404.1 hypothetical protein [Bacteroidales bacterium]MCM1205158.1 hypothetical protein [Bacillota bacterium]MCM1509405.1 hypothetical protein [Clostridium sp.]